VSRAHDIATSVRGFVIRNPPAVGAVYLFCLFMCFVYLPYDFMVKPLFRGIEAAEEVWFGYMLRGFSAKLTEPLHWAIYAALAYGFSRERSWAWTCAALYIVQVAIGSVVWVWLYADYGPLGYALTPVVVAGFLGLAWLVARARP